MSSVVPEGGPWERAPTLEDLPDPGGKAVLIRATFDRPLSADAGQPLARRRADGLADTVTWLASKAAHVTVCGSPHDSEGSLSPSQLQGVRHAVEAVSSSPLADSVAFTSSYEDPLDVERLVDANDLFVNDSLQDSLLPMPSLTIPARRLPSAVGRTLQRDLEILERLLVQPARPFVAICGGERSIDRLRGLQGLVLRADTVLLGGALALPMLQALGRQSSEGATEAFLWQCRNVLGLSRRVRHEIVLPSDLVWRRPDGSTLVTPATERGGVDVVDVGPRTRVRFAEAVEAAGTVVWAGALGQVEAPDFACGTVLVAESLPGRSLVVLGGDALVNRLAAEGKLTPSMTMLSATDAAIELLKNGDLPALAALRRR
jgi:phosphoglycerate kinase